MFFKLWVSHGFRLKSLKDEDTFPGTATRVSTTVTGVGTAFGAWAVAVLGFTLDGTFTDKESRSPLDVESLDSLRRLRDATLSSESDSDSDSEPAGLGWLEMACSESLSGSETDNILWSPIPDEIIPDMLDLARCLGDAVQFAV